MNTHVTPPSSWLDLTGAQEFAADDVQLRELIATFQDSLSHEIVKIQAGLLASDALKVEHSLHALKGFISLFAHPVLAQAVTDLYQTSRNHSLVATRNNFETILPNLEALLGEVRAWSSRL
jgi:HPt (histidine-containing phosphotransfer) domain-containing protein